MGVPATKDLVTVLSVSAAADAGAGCFPSRPPSVENEFICKCQFGGVEHSRIRVSDHRIPGDTPPFMANDAPAVLARRVRSVLITVVPPG